MQKKSQYQLNSIKKLLKYTGLVITFFVLLIINCFGQSITWTKTYSGPYNYVEEAHSLCQSTDGNFFALGFSFDSVLSLNDLVLIMKLNPYGDTLWSKIIPNLYNKTVTSSVPTPDGGCIFTGNGDTAYTVRIDVNGNVVWRRNYGITSFQTFDIKKTADDGYLLSGSKLFNEWHGLLIKIDTLGYLQWQNTYSAGDSRSFNSIAFTNDNNYLVAGFITDTFVDTQHVQITKINVSGTVIWEKRYLINGVGGNSSKIVKILNGYLLTGTTSFGKVFLSKINENGDQYYSYIFISDKEESNWDTKILNENRYVLAMTRDSLPQLRNSRVIISDSSGNIIKDRIFRVPSSTGRIWLESILPQANGDIIFGGFSELYNDSTDFFLTRTDSLLNVPPIAISQNEILIPNNYKVFPVYPNPFNPNTIFRFELPRSQTVKLTLYDLTGRQIGVLYNEYKNPGTYQFEILSEAYNLSSGVYFLKFQTSLGFLSTSKIVLLK